MNMDPLDARGTSAPLDATSTESQQLPLPGSPATSVHEPLAGNRGRNRTWSGRSVGGTFALAARAQTAQSAHDLAAKQLSQLYLAHQKTSMPQNKSDDEPTPRLFPARRSFGNLAAKLQKFSPLPRRGRSTTEGTHDPKGRRARRPSVVGRDHWKRVKVVTKVNIAVARDLRDWRETRALVGMSDFGDTRTAEEREEKMRQEEELRRQRHILLPSSPYRTAWDCLQLTFVLYVALVVPFRLGFSVLPDVFTVGWSVDLLVDVYFIVDIVLNVRYFAFENHDDKSVVDDPRMIRNNYLRGWFVFDFISVLPITYVGQILATVEEKNGSMSKLFKVLRIFRIFKLFRLLRFRRLQHDNAFMKRWKDSSKLIKAIFQALFVTHFYTCLWFAVGNQADGWVTKMFPASGYCFVEDSDNLACLDSSSSLTQYLYTFWFCASLFLGSEVFVAILPRTREEIALTIFGQIIAAVLFGYILGAVGHMIASKNPLSEQVDIKIAELREFLADKHISKELRAKIHEYMHDLYEKKIYDVRSVTMQLPPDLASQLFNEMYGETLMRVPLFKDLKPAPLRKICLSMRPYTARKDEFIYEEGDDSQGLYVIETGKIEILKDMCCVTTYGPEAFFGEASLHGTETRESSALAVEASQLAYLTMDDLEEIAKQHPEVMKTFMDVYARKQEAQTSEMNKILEKVAAELNIPVESKAMEDVVAAAQGMTSNNLGFANSSYDTKHIAAREIQKHWRGLVARRKVQSMLKRTAASGSAETTNCVESRKHPKHATYAVGVDECSGVAPQLNRYSSSMGEKEGASSAHTRWMMVKSKLHYFKASHRTVCITGLQGKLAYESTLIQHLGRYGYVTAVTMHRCKRSGPTIKEGSWGLATFDTELGAQRCILDRARDVHVDDRTTIVALEPEKIIRSKDASVQATWRKHLDRQMGHSRQRRGLATTNSNGLVKLAMAKTLIKRLADHHVKSDIEQTEPTRRGLRRARTWTTATTLRSLSKSSSVPAAAAAIEPKYPGFKIPQEPHDGNDAKAGLPDMPPQADTTINARVDAAMTQRLSRLEEQNDSLNSRLLSIEALLKVLISTARTSFRQPQEGISLAASEASAGSALRTDACMPNKMADGPLVEQATGAKKQSEEEEGPMPQQEEHSVVAPAWVRPPTMSSPSEASAGTAPPLVEQATGAKKQNEEEDPMQQQEEHNTAAPAWLRPPPTKSGSLQ